MNHLIDIVILLFIVWAYVIIYRLVTKKVTNWRKAIGTWTVSGFIIVTFLLVVNFVLNREPESYRKAVELLEKDNNIISKIGHPQSESYYIPDLPKSSDNPAHVKSELIGPTLSMYVSCIMERDNSGQWKLKSVIQDSIVTNSPSR
jgi:hypothetical protein